jgi:hypothetical protein
MQSAKTREIIMMPHERFLVPANTLMIFVPTSFWDLFSAIIPQMEGVLSHLFDIWRQKHSGPRIRPWLEAVQTAQ